MAEQSDKSRGIEWYTVSFEAVRAWVGLAILVVLAVVGFFGYRALRGELVRREVTKVVFEAGRLLQDFVEQGGADLYPKEYETAWRNLEEAKALFARGDADEALKSAERSRTLLAALLTTLSNTGALGEARIIAVEGRVEYRRGDSGAWQPARSRSALNAGDYVKTSGGASAEIMMANGALYTVRSNTVILVGNISFLGSEDSRERAVNVEGGWVDLNTGQNAGLVTTPQAEARVQEDSRAVVGYDEATNVSSFSTHRGRMQVASKQGETRVVGPLEQIVHEDERLSQSRLLPSVPALLEPTDNLEISLAEAARLVLSWVPVDSAEGYALQVGRNRLFVDNVIDAHGRSATQATLGLQGEGIFYWRVAALGAGDQLGPWSSPRRFRVTDVSLAN